MTRHHELTKEGVFIRPKPIVMTARSNRWLTDIKGKTLHSISKLFVLFYSAPVLAAERSDLWLRPLKNTRADAITPLSRPNNFVKLHRVRKTFEANLTVTSEGERLACAKLGNYTRR